MLSVAIKSGKSVKKVSGVCSAFSTMAISSVVTSDFIATYSTNFLQDACRESRIYGCDGSGAKTGNDGCVESGACLLPFCEFSHFVHESCKCGGRG